VGLRGEGWEADAGDGTADGADTVKQWLVGSG
jgi:hypothetical protein